MSKTKFDQAKEFWIIKEKGYSTWVSDKALKCEDTEEEIHVIEFSAYEQAQARIKQLEALIGDMNHNLEEFLKKADEVLG